MDGSEEINNYHSKLSNEDRKICEILQHHISETLKEHASSKVWHAHPVWFIEGNPVVGYSKRKSGINLMFWSGQGFTENGLTPEGKFKAAEIKYLHSSEVNTEKLTKWLKESVIVQWDYKNLIKRKGILEPISPKN